jgi:sulfatase modifying factor 1
MIRIFPLGLFVFLACHVPVLAQAKDPPKYFKNSVGMKFVWIEPGTFVMGSPQKEKDRFDNEVQHQVKLTRGFYMGVTPVTQDQWYAVISPVYTSPVEEFDLANPSTFVSGKNLPVETVCWDDCQIFIKHLRAKEKDKHHYRLPTEAEWEYACRAGTTTAYNFGDSISPAQANYFVEGGKGNSKKSGPRKSTTSVGSYPPNAWGLFDMHGNVAQWCQDRFSNYPQQSVVDPQGPDKRGACVLRGGSWEDSAARCRSAFRAWDSPDNRGQGTFGLRLCFSLE